MSILGATGIGSIVELGKSILERVIPDPTAKAEALQKLAELEQRGELAQLAAETDLLKGQLDINKEEAKSANLFVAGWRPFIGWVCGINLGWTWIFAPLLNWIATLLGAHVNAPSVPANETYPLVLALLGIGAQRSFDKSKGTATSLGGVVLTPSGKTPTASVDPKASVSPPNPLSAPPVMPADPVEVAEAKPAPMAAKGGRWIK